FGGTAQDNLSSLAVKEPEMYDEELDTWTRLTEHKVPRIYHSGALLLQDGRIWTIGTSYDTKPVGELPAFDLRTEIYKPDYFFETRPVITDSPSVGEYGGTITIQTPDANTINKVSLLKVSTTTHHYNTDQRLVWLQIDPDTRTDSSITVKAPINSKLATPGYYMLHIINSGEIPSAGSMIKITFPPPQPVFYDIAQSSGVNIDYVTLRAGGDTRAGVEVLSGSALLDRQLKTWTVYLRKTTTNASGVVTATIRKKFNDDDVTSFTEQIQASALTTSYQPYVFTLPSPHTIQANDRILIEYSGTNAIRIDVWNIDKLDGGKTRRVKFGSALTYSASNTKDASGTMSSE
ncbi:MAG TPA: galactose oxidase-like domain-containing protein, partial [Nitrososphaera sp.]|nr:galactose oxidase-like domain-containing protein [Nitrososphaera sp.]